MVGLGNPVSGIGMPDFLFFSTLYPIPYTLYPSSLDFNLGVYGDAALALTVKN